MNKILRDKCVYIKSHPLHDQTQVIRTHHSFFNTPVVVKKHNDCIVFKKPDLDYKGRTLGNGNADKNGSYAVTISYLNLPEGTLEISEDSTEDELIVYY